MSMLFKDDNDIPYMLGPHTKFGIPSNISFQLVEVGGWYELIGVGYGSTNSKGYGVIRTCSAWLSKDVRKSFKDAANRRGEQLLLFGIPE